MLLEKNRPVSFQGREAFRYQPSFDLRKNIAKILAYYSSEAFAKNIVLDIFVSPETPNYYQGNSSSFMVTLLQLLRHAIEWLNGGEISIRIHHDSLHQKNSCETEVSIILTINKALQQKSSAGTERSAKAEKPDTKLSDFNALHRIQMICHYLNGTFSMQKLDECRTQFLVVFHLQQAHSARMLHVV